MLWQKRLMKDLTQIRQVTMKVMMIVVSCEQYLAYEVNKHIALKNIIFDKNSKKDKLC